MSAGAVVLVVCDDVAGAFGVVFDVVAVVKFLAA